jgi:hypothetical protein
MARFVFTAGLKVARDWLMKNRNVWSKVLECVLCSAYVELKMTGSIVCRV